VRIGVDSSIIVAAVHTRHPRHSVAAHELVVCHHSILEAYAVLTRLPGDLRVQPSEARDLLAATVKASMSVTGFKPAEIWKVLELFVPSSVAGGHSYDAFVAHAPSSSGAEAMATLDPKHFQDLVEGLGVISP
jgi:predicted nucleic acid-binding protein